MGEARRRKQMNPGFGQQGTSSHRRDARIITAELASHEVPGWITELWGKIVSDKHEDTYDVVELSDGRTKSYAIAYFYVNRTSQKMYAKLMRGKEDSPLSFHSIPLTP